jgi:hypothetical protein
MRFKLLQLDNGAQLTVTQDNNASFENATFQRKLENGSGWHKKPIGR